ncbi:MAG: hypothetical protein AAF227_12485, partial [Pseudomonadota bacterium]
MRGHLSSLHRAAGDSTLDCTGPGFSLCPLSSDVCGAILPGETGQHVPVGKEFQMQELTHYL